jgi:hypothetical protein
MHVPASISKVVMVGDGLLSPILRPSARMRGAPDANEQYSNASAEKDAPGRKRYNGERFKKDGDTAHCEKHR